MHFQVRAEGQLMRKMKIHWRKALVPFTFPLDTRPEFLPLHHSSVQEYNIMHYFVENILCLWVVLLSRWFLFLKNCEYCKHFSVNILIFFKGLVTQVKGCTSCLSSVPSLRCEIFTTEVLICHSDNHDFLSSCLNVLSYLAQER